jgi:C1A family cysteine protease
LDSINIYMPSNHPSQIIDPSQDPSVSPTTGGVVRRQIGQLPLGDDFDYTLKYKLTAVKDRTDSRDYLFAPPTALPPATKVDLRQWCSVVNDQGSLGSCTAEAITSAIELVLKRENRLTELSRLFVYYQERLLEGTVQTDSGAYLRSGIKACATLGASAESLWQYNIRMFTVKPPTAAYLDALKRKITLYERCTTLDNVRAALALGKPVVVSFLVYSSFMTTTVRRTGMMPYPNKRLEPLLGGHAVCLVGYDDSRRVFIAKNSWGTSWGDRGYFYMPYQVIADPLMGYDYWAITAAAK